MSFHLTSRQSLVLFLGVLLGAFLIRVMGNDFGLPQLFHPDEKFEVNRALQLGTGSYDFERSGKGGYFYLLFVEFGFLFVFAYLFGWISSAQDFAIWFVTDPTVFYLVGRTTTALIGVATIWLLYKLVLHYADRKAALVAALFLAVNPLHVEHSHYITVDVPLTFFVVAVFLLLARLPAEGGTKRYLLVGACIAFAAMTKLPGVLLVLPAFIAHVMTVKSNGESWAAALADRRLWLAALTFLVVFVLGNPGAVVNAGDYFGFMGSVISGAPDKGPAEGLLAAGQSETSLGLQFRYYLDKLIEGFSLPLLLLAASIAFFASRNNTLFLVNASIFCFVVFGLFVLSGREDLVFGRYLLPIIPLLCAFAAIALVSCLDRVNKNSVAVLSFCVIGFVVLPLSKSVQDTRQLALPDTRSIGLAWFEGNIAENSRVWVEGYTARASNSTIPLTANDEVIDRALIEFRRRGESGKAKFFEIERDHVNSPKYDLMFYDGSKGLIWNEEMKAQLDFLVIRDEAVNVGFLDRQELLAFYEAIRLDEDVELIQEFKPEVGQRIGPSIRVYKIINE